MRLCAAACVPSRMRDAADYVHKFCKPWPMARPSRQADESDESTTRSRRFAYCQCGTAVALMPVI